MILSLGVTVIPLAAFSQSCAHPGAPGESGGRIAEAALGEYREFNGHRIDASGYLVDFGSTETENEWLNDPDTGEASRSRSDRFAWRRVWAYWLALERHVPGEAMRRKVIATPGILNSPPMPGRSTEVSLETLLRDTANVENGNAAAGVALREAAIRAAVSDAPWSAAFISYLMDKAGLDDARFVYSATHTDYIKRAFDESDTGYAYRACDPRTTRPRPGDLLCFARGKSALIDFQAWRDAVGRPGFAAPAHCEAVVNIDHAASKVDTVGGNVMQSVVLRKLKLNARGHLSESHRPGAGEDERHVECLTRPTCRRQNFNTQHWGVLLQMK